jgi:hypothetical protein
MSADLKLTMEDRPGALAKVGEALGRAGINIDGICAFTSEGKGTVHVLVADGAKARKVLEANKIEVAATSEVLVLEVEDRPGILANIARRLATANINIQLAYLATSTRLVLGVDDLAQAAATLKPAKRS